MRTLRRMMTWHKSTVHSTFIRKGDRMLAIEARCHNGEWGCIAIEGPAKFSAKTAAEAIGEVFDDHNHQVIVATPRKKGGRVVFADVQQAAKKFARGARKWHIRATVDPSRSHERLSRTA